MASAAWSIAAIDNFTMTPASGGAIAPGATVSLSFTATVPATYTPVLTCAGATISGASQPIVVSAAAATTATLALASTGTTGSATTGTVTLNGVAPAAGSITIAGGAGATATPGTLAWTLGEAGTAKSFTISYAADGAHSVSISSGITGVTVAGNPASHTTSTVIAPAFTNRIANKNLIVDVAAGTALSGTVGGNLVTPARVGIAAPVDDFIWGIYGPNADYFDVPAKSAWRVQGGDWIDKTGARQATGSPYFTLAANAVASGSSAYSSIDVAQAVTDAYRRGQWCEFIVRSTAARSIASQNHPTLTAPRIVGTYPDGSAFTLACTACVQLTTTASTAYTQIGALKAAIGSTNVALGFELPTQEALTATLQLVVDDHTATAATITGNLIDPPVNAQPVTAGIAASYTLDAGLSAAGTVVLAQNFADGTALSDYVIPYATTAGLDVFALSAWDAQVYGGAANTAKLPTAHNGTPIAASGKWFHKQDSTARISLVNSSYTGDNFQPRLPGLGALRIIIPASAVADGGDVGSSGAASVDLMTLLPIGSIGQAAESHVRFSIRPAWRPKTLATTKMYRNGSGAAAHYVVPTGKFGIGVHHLTSGAGWSGGSNNDGGDNLGWSGRLGYTAAPADAPFAGTAMFVHSQDMRPAHANLPIGKDGGLGAALFCDVWTDIEVYIKLNTYNPAGAVGTSASDGVIQVWINGRLDSTHTGWKWRDGAIDYGVTPNGPSLAPFGNLGIKGLWMNFYEGGVTPPEQDMIWFVAGLAATVG